MVYEKSLDTFFPRNTSKVLPEYRLLCALDSVFKVILYTTA